MSILITQKIGMISLIDNQGLLSAVTLLKVEPNFISQIKTKQTDGYDAIQISSLPHRKVAKAQQMHLKKAGIESNLKKATELRFKDDKQLTDWQLGQEIKLEDWQVGDCVEASGISKGKGFAGTIKRHNFSRGPKTHGGKGSTRRPGSIGTIGQGIMKGQKMAGRLGGGRTTVKGLSVSLIDSQKKVIGIKGALPGPKKSLIIIRKA